MHGSEVNYVQYKTFANYLNANFQPYIRMPKECLNKNGTYWP